MTGFARPHPGRLSFSRAARSRLLVAPACRRALGPARRDGPPGVRRMPRTIGNVVSTLPSSRRSLETRRRGPPHLTRGASPRAWGWPTQGGKWPSRAPACHGLLKHFNLHGARADQDGANPTEPERLGHQWGEARRVFGKNVPRFCFETTQNTQQCLKVTATPISPPGATANVLGPPPSH